MNNIYHMSDIIKYEALTKKYCKMEYLDEESPDIEILIDCAYKEKEFNVEYCKYVIEKYLQIIVDYVYEIKGINISNIHALREDIYNNNVDENACEKWLADCKEDNLCCCYQDTLEVIIDRNYIAMLYYYYYSEEKKLTEYLTNRVNKLNDRKFFIVQ